MRYYLGVTDYNWFSFLRDEKADEVNFWQPSGRNKFRVIGQGAPFLFKLKAPHNAIGGVGWMVSHSILPLSVAWDFFGHKNGVPSFHALREKIINYRRDEHPNPPIGCILLTDPVFFEEKDWISVPASWANSIVQGKSYDTSTQEGRLLWQEVEKRLEVYRWTQRAPEEKAPLVEDPSGEYRYLLSKVRIGQGGFRSLITEAYQRRCAISGEKTLPVLEAAHIKPYKDSGPHKHANGLLLRSDLHTLFDTGYMTITTDKVVEVSPRIREEFQNGKEYYRFHGKPLLILPEQVQKQPGNPYLSWHNEHIYKG